MTVLTNWSGNYTYRAPRIQRPDSIERLQETWPGPPGSKRSAAGTASTTSPTPRAI